MPTLNWTVRRNGGSGPWKDLDIELPSNAVNTPTIGTLYLLPPVKAETVSPGCEGEGEASVSVMASGDGP